MMRTLFALYAARLKNLDPYYKISARYVRVVRGEDNMNKSLSKNKHLLTFL
jgi:hypothetical protein